MATVTTAPPGGRAPTFACTGPDAEDFLQRMVSNDVTQPATSCEALLLTPKARLIAPLVVWRRGDDDFLLLTEPELGETVRDDAAARALRARSARSSPRSTRSTLVFGDAEGLPTRAAGTRRGARRAVSSRRSTRTSSSGCGSRRASRAGASELDESILPAEAGLDETHISFTKGCYPGQEPIARLHHRGHVNRRLRVLDARRRRAARRRDPRYERQGRRPRDERGARRRARLRAGRGADDAELDVAGRSATLMSRRPS